MLAWSWPYDLAPMGCGTVALRAQSSRIDSRSAHGWTSRILRSRAHSVNAMVCKFLTIGREVRLSARELKRRFTTAIEYAHGSVLYRRVRLHAHYIGLLCMVCVLDLREFFGRGPTINTAERKANADALMKQEWNGGSGWEFCPTTITVATGFNSSALCTTSFGFRWLGPYASPRSI
jgi:hypothetical protein